MVESTWGAVNSTEKVEDALFPIIVDYYGSDRDLVQYQQGGAS